MTGLTYDRRVSTTTKGKVYKKVLRPSTLYGLEAAALTKQDAELEVTGLKMRRLGVKRMERIKH